MNIAEFLLLFLWNTSGGCFWKMQSEKMQTGRKIEIAGKSTKLRRQPNLRK